MPARRIRQPKEIKELFYLKIKEKVQKEKEDLKVRIDKEVPPWASWAMKSLVCLYRDWQNARTNSKGEDGEFSVFFDLWLLLPKDWIIINNVVLEPEQDEFIQLDHLLIGPPGIFIIETKAWDGAFTAYRDNWKRKEGKGWVRCSSPIKQNKRHVKLFIKWLESGVAGELPVEINSWLFPVVVFTRAKWLKVSDCSMPVFDGALGLSLYIRRFSREQRLSVEQIDIIAEAVVNAKPFSLDSSPVFEQDLIGEAKDTEVDMEEKSENKAADITSSKDISSGTAPKTERRQTKDGRTYVRIYGTEEQAKDAQLKLSKAGENVGQLKKDRYHKDAWYFYLQ